jgi:hypothetical protein
MFSDVEVELVTRNIEQVLRFHETFVDELRAALMPVGFSTLSNGSEADDMLQLTELKEDIGPHLERAIVLVSKMFTRQASRTNSTFFLVLFNLLICLNRQHTSIYMRLSVLVTQKRSI